MPRITFLSTFCRTGLLLAGGTLCLAAWSQPTLPSPQGRWLTASGNVEVDVAPCGAALCGTISKVLANRSMSRDGEAMKTVDTRPALGMKILIDFVVDEVQAGSAGEPGAPISWRGEIYNRENGKHYRCTMALDEHGHLVVRPYVLLPLFGRTQIWQRVAASAEEGSKP